MPDLSPVVQWSVLGASVIFSLFLGATITLFRVARDSKIVQLKEGDVVVSGEYLKSVQKIAQDLADRVRAGADPAEDFGAE